MSWLLGLYVEGKEKKPGSFETQKSPPPLPAPPQKKRESGEWISDDFEVEAFFFTPLHTKTLESFIHLKAQTGSLCVLRCVHYGHSYMLLMVFNNKKNVQSLFFFLAYPTNNTLLINFWLSSDAEFFLLSTNWAYRLVPNVQKHAYMFLKMYFHWAFIFHTTIGG